jgi:hypothetical protein
MRPISLSHFLPVYVKMMAAWQDGQIVKMRCASVQARIFSRRAGVPPEIGMVIVVKGKER